MQPDRQIAEAWQRFSLATAEQIQANMRELADPWGQSMEEFAEGLRTLAHFGNSPATEGSPDDAA